MNMAKKKNVTEKGGGAKEKSRKFTEVETQIDDPLPGKSNQLLIHYTLNGNNIMGQLYLNKAGDGGGKNE